MTTTDKSYPLLLAAYKNGNYTVTFYSDGTKIKHTDDDYFIADFPDSIDLKITDFCDVNCPMCHEASSIGGAHADLSAEFLNTLHKGTELAIGGGNPLSHPELIDFLNRMKKQKVICNLTVNEKHFLADKELIGRLMAERLIWGLGISLNEFDNRTLSFASENGNVVIHLICGIVTEQQLKKLGNKNLKVLFLGYKHFGRGLDFYSTNIESNIDWLKNNISELSSKFNTTCFDNLALTQLDLKNQIPQELYEKRYMGDDGVSSMYIDLVGKEFAVNSTSAIRYPIENNIQGMFKKIRKTT